MTDEPEQPDDDLGDIEFDEGGDSEYVEVEGAMIVACRGWRDV